MKYACLVFLVAAAGCTSPNPASCLEDNFCSDPAKPYCDKDGTVAGTAGACIAVSCTAGAFLQCTDDKTASVCTPTGDNYGPVPCEFGCGSGGCLPCNTAGCEKHIIPKYLPSVCDQLTTNPEKTIAVDTMVDTTSASMCDQVVTQVGGPEICVLRGATVTVEAGKTLSAKGTRVLALVADRNLTIAGIVDVSANSTENGPGGGVTKSGTDAGAAGGGAGYRTPGAAGGANSGDGGSNDGGPATSNPNLITTLLGGTQPTRVAPNQLPGGAGGGVTVISCRGAISVTGTIDAGGGGGLGDFVVAQPVTFRHASGGGSGGTVVLQASSITVSGGIFANGGAGGGGGSPGNNGSDGLRSTMPAPGAPMGGVDMTGGAGGYGGALVPPTSGARTAPPDCGLGCGAGGASAGYILTYLPLGSTPVITSAMFSPPIEPNAMISTN